MLSEHRGLFALSARLIFDFAVSKGVTDRNPAIALTPLGPVNPVASAFVPEVFELRKHVIFRLTKWDGMRPGEIICLQLAAFEGDSV